MTDPLDPYQWAPFIPAFHLIPSPRGTSLAVPSDPSRLRPMDDTAIRDLTEAVRELTAELQRVGGVLGGEHIARRSRTRSDASSESGHEVPRATWLTPIEAAWDKELGAGSFPIGSALKPLAQLRKKGHSEAEIGKRLGFYCRHLIRSGEIQFASVPKFAQTFNQWQPDAPAWEDGDE